MRRTAVAIPEDELRAMLIELIGRAEEPLAIRTIRSGLPRAYRPAENDLRDRLEALAREKKVHEWPRRKYWSRSIESLIRSAIETTVLGAADIAKATLVPRTTVSRILSRLVGAGVVHEHPKDGRQRRYSVRRPSVRDIVEPKLLELVTKLEKKEGLKRREILAAIAEIAGGSESKADPARLLEAIADLDSKRGALVYIPHLRTAVASSYGSKESFDRDMLVLFTKRKIDLQSHPTPSALSAREKERMIEDGKGSYYSAVALR